MYIMNWKLLFTTLAAALSLASCVSTPASRIQKNPALFNSLPPSQKTLVEAGQIAEGNLNGKSATRWIYSSLQPVYTPPPSFWAGPYWGGPYWGPGFYRPYYPYYNDVTYVPVDTGYVLFINGKVKSWERRR